MKFLLEEEDRQSIVEALFAKLEPLLAGKRAGEADQLMTIGEAAVFLNTSKGQIYQWVNNSQHGLGSFPYYKAGKLLRFSKDEILAWMKSNKKRLENG